MTARKRSITFDLGVREGFQVDVEVDCNAKTSFRFRRSADKVDYTISESCIDHTSDVRVRRTMLTWILMRKSRFEKDLSKFLKRTLMHKDKEFNDLTDSIDLQLERLKNNRKTTDSVKELLAKISL